MLSISVKAAPERIGRVSSKDLLGLDRMLGGGLNGLEGRAGEREGGVETGLEVLTVGRERVLAIGGAMVALAE